MHPTEFQKEHNPIHMAQIVKYAEEFENWFNVKFGWFFTNGSKG